MLVGKRDRIEVLVNAVNFFIWEAFRWIAECVDAATHEENSDSVSFEGE